MQWNEEYTSLDWDKVGVVVYTKSVLLLVCDNGIGHPSFSSEELCTPAW